MAKSVYVPEAGGIIDFPDDATPQQMLSYIKSRYSVAKGPAVTPPPEAGPDESGILGRFAYGLGTGLTDVPGGIASLFYPAEEAAKTTAGQFSEEARKYLQETFGIDPTKDPTAAQQAAQALGSVASFLVPGAGVAKGASLLGKGAALAGRAAATTAGAQGVALGASQRAQTIEQQLASGMNISEEDQLAAQRLSGLIGASEALPINRFFGPLSTILSKVPVSKAPVVEQIVKSRLGRITRAGVAEGAQEAAAGIANDIMEYGVYNPDVQIGQDLLSNAGTGAFAGSFVEGVIQLAAGRKLRPYRQLQQDIEQEKVENYQAARQGRISQAAENLRQYNVSGPVEIAEQEFDGLPAFTIRTESGNELGSFTNREDAVSAVNLYANNTAAKISIKEKLKAPDVFPVKIGKKKYGSLDEIFTARNEINEKRNSLIPIVSDPITLKKEADARGVSSELYKSVVMKQVEKYDSEIQKFDDFIDIAEPAEVTETIETPTEGITAASVTEAVTEPVIGATETTAPQPSEEAVIGLASAGPAIEPTTGIQPATAPQPERGEGVPAADVEPRSMREAAMMGPRVRAFTPEASAKYKKIYDDLEKSFEAISPPEVRLNFREFIDDAGPEFLVRGAYKPGDRNTGTKGVIDLAMGIWDPSLTTEQMIQKMLGVLNHEVIHALRNSGRIRPAEWNLLSKAASNIKVPGKKYTYLDKAQAIYTERLSPEYANPDAVVEEAVAEMYKDWVSGRNNKEARNVGGLLNRITEFLRRIFRVLKNNSYENVFKAIESGEVRSREAEYTDSTGTVFSAAPISPAYNPRTSTSEWETSGTPPFGVSSVNKTGGSPYRISQRRPTTKKTIGESLANNLLVDVASMKLEPGQFEQNINIVNSYPGFRPIKGELPEQTLKRFKKMVVDNLLWLHDTMDPTLRQRAKLWYDGARKITDNLAARYNLPDTTVAAVLAGLSPQKDWFQNVSLAERLIDIVKTKGDVEFSEAMIDYARTRPSLSKYGMILEAMEGVKYKDLDGIDYASILARKHNEIVGGLYTKAQIKMLNKGNGILAKSIFVRIYDEMNNARDYSIITPEGDKGALSTTGAGTPSKVAWGSFTEIGKGISAIENGSKENIDRILGDKHKIRNFYNNIISPKSKDGSVTIDTHAVAAGLLRALSGNSTEVHHNFGTSVSGMEYRTKNSSKTGVHGMYAIYADAYRDAAKMRGILPREMQSITWEAVRGLYKATFKAQARNVDAIDAIWKLHGQGKINANEARKRILDIADPGAVGINSPFWRDTPSTGIYGIGGPPLNIAGVGAVGVRPTAGGTVSGGTVGTAGSVKGAKPGVKFSAAPALNTEEFKKWFAGSKGVNPDGTPKVFYHGTSKDQIYTKFKTGPRGIFFTEDPVSASEYAIQNDSMDLKPGPGWSYTKVNTASRVIPVYLSYKNPYTPTEDDIQKLNRGSDYRKAQRELFEKVRRVDPTIDAINFAEGVVVVFDPKQAKSTLNSFEPGAATSPRFSAAPAVGSDEFRNWFGNSKTVKPDGTPKVYYHGTPFSFKAFGKSRSAAIGGEEGPFFFSESPKFANQYAETRLYKGARGEDVKSGGRVLPVYISTQNPFDYENDAHIVALKGAIGDISPSVENNIRSGMWKALEAPAIQRAIRRLGFDGVYLNEAGFKNLAIYRPEQVKSIFNQFETGAAESTRFSAAPLPAYIETKNSTLFRPTPNRSFFKTVTEFFTGPAITGQTLTTPAYGNLDVSKGTRRKLAFKSSVVDRNAIVEFLEKLENKQRVGEFDFSPADYSAVFAMMTKDRASHLTASNIMMGGIGVKFARPGDIQSATLDIEESPDNLLEVFKILLQPGAPDPVTGKMRDKREIFKSYAAAKRAIGLKAAGKPVPRELDDTYINTVIPFTQTNYPEVVQAYDMYQRVNKKVLVALRDSGRISDAELANLSRDMNYYGFFREVHAEELVPGVSAKTAGKIQLRPYTGSELGNLIDDPMFVMISNMQFLIDSMAKNLAVTKVFNLAKNMGEARLLGQSEMPDQSLGESSEVMFYHDKGVLKRFAVKDPLLVKALGADDRLDFGGAMKLVGLSTSVIRESVTRDPAFLIANLLRDTVSSWITSGENIIPFWGTGKGFAQSLKQTSSFKALMGRGAVGSYDLAMREPAELAAIIQRRIAPKNLHIITNPGTLAAIAGAGWDKLGVWSEASDAATRVAVYEAAKAQGLSDAEATFRAIKIMDFSRRGSSTFLNVLTKMVPFLNARIQGLDVLYQAGAAAYRVVKGEAQSERDANLGKKFLVRGALLMALSLFLEAVNDGDEAYEELPDYVKKGNVLIPLSMFGVDGDEFIAIPNPFETGLLFSTLPRQLYQTARGNVSTRENINFFVESYASTFGINPIPQIALPALEVLVNHDFYTGLPLISEGKARLSPELQYDSRTSTLARIIGDVPIKYNFTTGKFEGVSPIVIDQLIGGYAGPFGTLLVSGVGYGIELFDAGPERLPRDLTQMPVVKRFFVDAESRSPKTVSDAYELFRIVDEANRSFSRLRQTGDAEAVADYLDENKDVLKYKKYVYTLVDRLNKLSAYERQIERDKTMTDEEKREAMNRLREVRKRLTAKVGEINKALGR